VTANNSRIHKEKTRQTTIKSTKDNNYTEVQPAAKHVAPTSHVRLPLSYCIIKNKEI